MLTLRDVYKLQSDYGVADNTFKDCEISFEEYVAQCRAFISANLPDAYTSGDWTPERKNNELVSLVGLFIEKHRIAVQGYMTEEGIFNSDRLYTDLCDSILGEALIRDALEDPDVDEIQINDYKTIFVVKKGVTVPYIASDGRVLKFSNNDEVLTLLNKLIDDGTGNIPQFTEGVPLLNAKTAKHQYRINAVHPVANTMDKSPNNRFPVTTIVIRKFKESNLTIDDLVRGGTCSAKMGRLLMMLGRGEQLKLFCVGPTGSGKTTLLRIIASTIPEYKRMILIQNPTEISFFDRDTDGRNKRNVLHWEVVQNADPNSHSSATMENLISNALRATPEVIIIGEAREPGEFIQIERAMKTGHKLLGTFHAEGAMDAVGRFAKEIGGNYNESIREVASSINVIVSQFKYENGERRIKEITEILGTDEQGKPILNTLFRFNGMLVKQPDGRFKVEGEFEQRGVLSEHLVESLTTVGISMADLKEFMNESDIVTRPYKLRQ